MRRPPVSAGMVETLALPDLGRGGVIPVLKGRTRTFAHAHRRWRCCARRHQPPQPAEAPVHVPGGPEATTFSRAFFYRLESQGHIRLVRFGSKTLVPIEAIDAILTGKLDRKDGHRAQHWHGVGAKPRRPRGRPRKPSETAPATAAE